MKLPRRSGKTGALDSVVELAFATASIIATTGDRQRYSTSLEFGLTEQVRERMRTMAQNGVWGLTSRQLLQTAFDEVMSELSQALATRDLELELALYGKKIKAELKNTAKEIHKLSQQLSRSRLDKRLGEKEALRVDSGESVVVQELGLRDFIHGLLVEAPEAMDEINIEALHDMRGWNVEGGWFPYEVYSPSGAVFVIDDDGSIFVSTEGLHGELLADLHGQIRLVAESLNRPILYRF